MASLRDLGLSEYEARAYRALLQTGPTTAKDLSAHSEVPMGRIYDVLTNLERHDLVRSQGASHPTKYAPVEPETGLDRLLDERKRALHERAQQYEDTVDELRDDLDDQTTASETRFWTAAVGPEESIELLVERLATADEQITMVSGNLSPHVDVSDVSERIGEELDAALNRDVSVSMLVSPTVMTALPTDIRDSYLTAFRDHNDFEIRINDDVEGTFNLIDQQEVCVEVPNPLEAGETFALIDLKDREFAADAQAVVEPQWEQSEPLRLESL